MEEELQLVSIKSSGRAVEVWLDSPFLGLSFIHSAVGDNEHMALCGSLIVCVVICNSNKIIQLGR